MCGQGIGDANGMASNALDFRVVLSLSLFVSYIGQAHELSRDMFFPQSCSSRDSYKQSLKKLSLLPRVCCREVEVRREKERRGTDIRRTGGKAGIIFGNFSENG